MDTTAGPLPDTNTDEGEGGNAIPSVYIRTGLLGSSPSGSSVAAFPWESCWEGGSSAAFLFFIVPLFVNLLASVAGRGERLKNPPPASRQRKEGGCEERRMLRREYTMSTKDPKQLGAATRLRLELLLARSALAWSSKMRAKDHMRTLSQGDKLSVVSQRLGKGWETIHSVDVGGLV